MFDEIKKRIAEMQDAQERNHAKAAQELTAARKTLTDLQGAQVQAAIDGDTDKYTSLTAQIAVAQARVNMLDAAEVSRIDAATVDGIRDEIMNEYRTQSHAAAQDFVTALRNADDALTRLQRICGDTNATLRMNAALIDATCSIFVGNGFDFFRRKFNDVVRPTEKLPNNQSLMGYINEWRMEGWNHEK